MNNNFDPLELLKQQTALDAAVIYDQKRRFTSDELCQKFYNFNTQTEKRKAMKYGPLKPVRSIRFNKIIKTYKEKEKEEELAKKKA